MSTWRSRTSDTGRRRWYAGTLAQTFKNAALVSFPPNPPPRRFVLHTTLLHGKPNAPAMSFWCFCGHCVLDSVTTSSLSPHHTRHELGSR